MSVIGGPNVIEDGLVLALDAANHKSYSGTGTTWSDLSGNGNNGTLINDPTFDPDNLGSIQFDGVNDRGVFTSTVSASSPQSYQVWAKAIPSTTAVGGFGYILHNNSASTNIGVAYMGIGYAGSGLQFREIYAFFDGNWSNMGTGVIGDANTVRQIVLTWDGVSQIAYVDGILRVSRSLTSTPSNFSSITSFANYRDDTYNRPIIGNIYSINAYNRALTPEEVLQNYNATKGRYGL